MEKVAPSEGFRRELDEALTGVAGYEDPIETVGRLGAWLILQQALEDEVSEFLGRARYERTEQAVSSRSGYEPRTVETTSGALKLERPQVRNASALGFESKVPDKGVARTHARSRWRLVAFSGACRPVTWRARWRKSSRSRSRPRAVSRGSLRTPGSDTACGVSDGWSSMTSSTFSSTRST
jgi:hypothetical protein